MENNIPAAISMFCFDGKVTDCSPYGAGHINQTFLVTTEKNKRYILQKISERAFPDVDGLMENVTGITEFLRKKNADCRSSLHVIDTVSGSKWTRDNEGCWRVYDYIEDTICLQSPETDEDFYQSAAGFGGFIGDLSDYPAETLHETIKNFHNTPDRYRIFKGILAKDPEGRVKQVQREIDFVLSREEEMSRLQAMRESGYLPTRVTHNDTKLNNVLLDKATRKALCVIDLDTVMPGLCAYDFGDSVRFGAATAAEDELNLEKMTINLHLYEVFTDGFTRFCRGITKNEKESLPLGAKIITMENGIRFLTDFLDGDHYYTIHRSGHNLDRARTQFKLVTEMDRHWDEMRFVAEKY